MLAAATSILKLKLKFSQYYQTAIYFAFVGLWFWSADKPSLNPRHQ
jgi:hypothetical protein